MELLNEITNVLITLKRITVAGDKKVMRYLLVIWILLFSGDCFSQIEPVQNYEEVATGKKLKTLLTMYYPDEDTSASTGRVLLRKEFNSEGKLALKYLYTFWDVVSYDHTITYQYDSRGYLTEETKIQQILNLGKRDDGYIKVFGDDPINEKIRYFYDKKDRLVKTVNYAFGKKGFDNSMEPSSIVQYSYDENDHLIMETGKTLDGRSASEDYISYYEYDSMGRKIKVTKSFSASRNGDVRTTMYSYTSGGLLSEEKTEDLHSAFMNTHLRYEYNESGRKTRVLSYSRENNDWREIKAFQYDKKGNLILGDEETTFDFYENGLIKRELWKSRTSDETVNFITTYEFY